ncbi:MAG: diguanylate cyclase [Bacillaceae bacterium]|nr:diguanylate cyclase [Bacillaceae bacterium]
MLPNKKTGTLVYLFLLNLVIIGIIEYFIMIFLERLTLPNRWEHLVDAVLLSLISLPFVYLFGVRFLAREMHEKRRLSLIFNGVSDLMFLMRVEPGQVFRCVEVNDAYLQATGMKREDVVGNRIEHILPPREADFVIGKYKEAVQQRDTLKYEEDVQLPVGTLIVETSLIPMLDETGNCTHLLGVSRDITESKKREDSLRRLSMVDGLTGIPNRRQFEKTLRKQWNRAIREKNPLSLLMLDIDRFKNYNDVYGHQAGDACLKEVARVLVDAATRPGDLAARYGGEEFMMILPDTDKDNALHIAENIRRDIESLDIKHPHSDTSSRVTVSIGVTTVVPGTAESADQMINRTDQAMYAAKKAGRNRIIYSDAKTVNL